MLFCDSCDRGFHMECCDPPLSRMPKGELFKHVYNKFHHTHTHAWWFWGSLVVSPVLLIPPTFWIGASKHLDWGGGWTIDRALRKRVVLCVESVEPQLLFLSTQFRGKKWVVFLSAHGEELCPSGKHPPFTGPIIAVLSIWTIGPGYIRVECDSPSLSDVSWPLSWCHPLRKISDIKFMEDI